MSIANLYYYAYDSPLTLKDILLYIIKYSRTKMISCLNIMDNDIELLKECGFVKNNSCNLLYHIQYKKSSVINNISNNNFSMLLF